MATDNVPVTPGTGATIRTFADASGAEWPAGVVAFVTTVSPGANVVVPVTPTAGLPVAQQGSWSFSVLAGNALIGQVELTDGTNVLGTPAHPVRTDPIGATTQPVSLASLPALGAGSNLIGGVSVQAATSGAGTLWQLVTAATTNAASVKGAAGVLYSIRAFNTAASPRYLKFFDKATSPAVGTDVPVQTIMIPPSNGGVVAETTVGGQFSSGIAVAVTGGIAANDATAVGAGDCVVNLTYK